MAASVVALVDDIFFLAKIQEAARAVGVTVRTIAPRLGPAAVAEAHPQSILLDLNSRSFSSLDWINALKSDPATAAIRIVAFVSHVQEQLIADARKAGCDEVMARSAFARKLPELLRSLETESKEIS